MDKLNTFLNVLVAGTVLTIVGYGFGAGTIATVAPELLVVGFLALLITGWAVKECFTIRSI